MTPSHRLTGAVAITGADGHVGHAIQRRFSDLPNRVIPLGRSDDWSSAIADAESVIHLAGTLQPRRPNTYLKANVGTVERCLSALNKGLTKRIMFLSYVGADPGSTNQYLRAKGQAEELIRACRVPSVILRSTFIYGELDDIGPSFATYQNKPGGSVSLLGDGTQRLSPIFVDDLADLVIAAALDPKTPVGTFEVSGPELFTLDDFVRHINPPNVKIRHLPAPLARPLARLMPQLTPALVDVLLRDSVAASDPTQTAGRFGVELHGLAGGDFADRRGKELMPLTVTAKQEAR